MPLASACIDKCIYPADEVQLYHRELVKESVRIAANVDYLVIDQTRGLEFRGKDPNNGRDSPVLILKKALFLDAPLHHR